MGVVLASYDCGNGELRNVSCLRNTHAELSYLRWVILVADSRCGCYYCHDAADMLQVCHSCHFFNNRL